MSEQTPAQVAEEKLREAQEAIDRIEATYRKGWTTVGKRDARKAITRALAARAWAQAERMHTVNCQCCSPRCLVDQFQAHRHIVDPRCAAERDRLRREWEAMK